MVGQQEVAAPVVIKILLVLLLFICTSPYRKLERSICMSLHVHVLASQGIAKSSTFGWGKRKMSPLLDGS